MRPRRGVIMLVALVFSLAAIVLLYEGVVTSNYLLVALVLVAYVFVLMLEVSLSLGARRQPRK